MKPYTVDQQAVGSKDEGLLAELGIKQELKREWTVLHSFGVSFSIISVITGVTTLFEYGSVAFLSIPSREWLTRLLQLNHWRAWCHVCWMDRGQLFHDVRGSQHGRNHFGDSIRWRSIFL